MKNTMAWWLKKKKEVGQPILIVDAETEPMASPIIFNRTFWYHFCGWKECIYFIYCSVVLKWYSSLAAKMLREDTLSLSQTQWFQLAKQLAIRKSIALINISLKKWQVSAE